MQMNKKLVIRLLPVSNPFLKGGSFRREPVPSILSENVYSNLKETEP